jgi:hypothetical protein
VLDAERKGLSLTAGRRLSGGKSLVPNLPNAWLAHGNVSQGETRLHPVQPKNGGDEALYEWPREDSEY